MIKEYKSYLFFGFSFFSGSIFSVGLFHGSFGSQGIDVSLTVSSFFLLFPESLNLFFLFIFYPLFLRGFLGLLSSFSVIIVNNFLLFLFNFECTLLFDKDGFVVGLGDFLEHFFGFDFFLDGFFSFLFLHLLKGLDHQLTLFFDLLLGADSLKLSLLNLLNNHFMVDLLLDPVLPFSFLGAFDGF